MAGGARLTLNEDRVTGFPPLDAADNAQSSTSGEIVIRCGQSKHQLALLEMGSLDTTVKDMVDEPGH